MSLTESETEKILSGLVIPVYKPLTWTSFQAVKKIKGVVFKALDRRIKIGHAGTLDPLADGLLLICTGKATRSIDRLQEQPKEYTGTITLGATTPSFDLETEPDHHFPFEHITREMAEIAAQSFNGPSMQAPPVYSARWVAGQRAYDLARQGLRPEIDSRPVVIHSFEITGFELPEVKFRIRCSKGTYIRSIARDFGLKLNSGAHLTALTRTAIGDFNLTGTLHPDTLTISQIINCDTWPPAVR